METAPPRSRTGALLLANAGLLLWATATLGTLWLGWPPTLACLASGVGAGTAAFLLARRAVATAPSQPPAAGPSAPRGRRGPPPAKEAPSKSPSGAAPPGSLLDARDRERLAQWLSEPIAILEAAGKKGEVAGFNHARACPGMTRIAAWRRSSGEGRPDADALLKAAEDALLAALIQAAEFFSPLLESLSRRGEVPPDFERSQERMEETRRRTVALLSELRARLANLPVSSQESFGF